MAKNLFISATEPNSGKSVFTLGLIHYLLSRGAQVGYFKPIGQRYLQGGELNEDVVLVKSLFRLDGNPRDMNPLSIDRARGFMAEGDQPALIEYILNAYQKVEEGKDTVIIEGTDYSGTISAFEFDINAEISKNLDAPVLLVADGADRSLEEIIAGISVCKESFDERGCDLLGIVLNKVAAQAHKEVSRVLEATLPKESMTLLGVIPHQDVLARPRIKDIADQIGARVLMGEEFLGNIAMGVKVAAMQVHNALDYFQHGQLLITPGDREDILLAALVARVTHTYPNISGIVLTGGLLPSANVNRLIKGLGEFQVPILSVPDDTFTTAVKVNGVPVSIDPTDSEKVEIINTLFDRYIKVDRINQYLRLRKPKRLTPIIFQHQLIERAKAQRKRIVLPEGDEERTLRAVEKIIEREIADPILLGNPDVILKEANRLGVKLGKERIINPPQAEVFEEYAKTYLELRKHKNITDYNARDIMTDPIYFGTMMVYKGHAEGLVSGAVHTTQHTIRPAFQFIKTRPGISLVSSVFFMCLADRVLVYGDCAVNPNPDAAELADIAISAAETARAFGIEPRVAMLSYSTGGSGKGPEVDKVREATAIAHKKRPDLLIEGPIQYDAAISPATARAKLPGSAVAGKATVFIFPDLDAGNTAYKAVQRSANAIAIGPVLQGLKQPVNDLSRGCGVEDIIYTVAITAIQAQSNKNG